MNYGDIVTATRKEFYYQSNLSHSYVKSQSLQKLAEVHFYAQKWLEFAKLLKNIETSSKEL